MSKAKVKSKPKTNTTTQQAPTTFPPFKPYTKDDLVFNVFTPKNNLLYMFIAEKIEPNDFILNQNSNSFLIKNTSDIQRFSYYPETKNIYTFFGFDTKEKRSKAMKNKAVINSAVDGVTTIYPIYQPPTKSTKSESKPQDHDNPTEKVDYSKFPEFIKYEKDDLKFHKFTPQSNLVYVFFAEKQEPTPKIIKSHFNKIYGIGYSLDIQRFRYYPGTKNIYSFMGFVNENVMHKASKVLQKVSLNRHVFNYPYQKPEENQEVEDKKSEEKKFFVPLVPIEKLPKFKAYSKNDLEFKEFLPKDHLFYLFLSEELEPTKQILNSTYTTLYGIKNASDIQRFCYYPHTKNLYTFIGFDDPDKRNIHLGNRNLKKFVVDEIISAFPIKIVQNNKQRKTYRNRYDFNSNTKPFQKKFTIGSNYNQQPTRKPDSSDLNKKSDETNNSSDLSKKSDERKDQNLIKFASLNESDSYDDSEEEFFEKSDTKQSSAQQKIGADDDETKPLFKEKIGIHYLCFLEKNCDVRNVRLQNATNLFGIKKIKEVQRGVRFTDGNDPNYYTFFGFEKTKERTEALIVLQKQTDSINIKTLQEINEFEYDYDDDDDDEADVENDEEYEEIEEEEDFFDDENDN